MSLENQVLDLFLFQGTLLVEILCPNVVEMQPLRTNYQVCISLRATFLDAISITMEDPCDSERESHNMSKITTLEIQPNHFENTVWLSLDIHLHRRVCLDYMAHMRPLYKQTGRRCLYKQL